MRVAAASRTVTTAWTGSTGALRPKEEEEEAEGEATMVTERATTLRVTEILAAAAIMMMPKVWRALTCYTSLLIALPLAFALSLAFVFPLSRLCLPSLSPLFALSLTFVCPLSRLCLPSLSPLFALSLAFVCPLSRLCLPSLSPLFALCPLQP
jgi:hypothetical protein